MKNVDNLLVFVLLIIVIIGIQSVFATPDGPPAKEPNWKTYHAIGKYLNSDPPKHDQVFNIKYRAINGVIESFEESGLGYFLTQVNSLNNGTLEILIPRNYPYTNGFGEGHGKSFTVSNHNEPQKNYEVKLEETNCFFEYSIPFTGDQRLELSFVSITVATPFHGDEVTTNCINETIYLPPPTKQFKSGIAVGDIKCKENYQKIFKIKNGYPACVKPSSISKLMARGWTDWGLTLSEKEKSAILNVAMQDPLFQELLIGKNWYVWGINSSVSSGNDCPFGSCHEIIIGQTDPNRQLVVLVNSATNKVIDISRTPAW